MVESQSAARRRSRYPVHRCALICAAGLLFGCGSDRVLRGEVVQRGAEPAGRELARWSPERCVDASGAPTTWPVTARFVALHDGVRSLFETRVDGDSLRFAPGADGRAYRAAIATDQGVIAIEWRFDRAPDAPDVRAELRVATGEAALHQASWAAPLLRLRCEGLRR